MESLSYFKNIRVSPKKMRFMLAEVKKLKPAEALDYLMYSPKRTAKIYYKAVHSAIENAKNTLKVSPTMLQFKLFTIEQGPVMKRFQPGSRGTANPIKKRFSHIKISLTVAKESKAVSTEEKKSAKQKKETKTNVETKAKAVSTAKKTVKSEKDSVAESKE